MHVDFFLLALPSQGVRAANHVRWPSAWLPMAWSSAKHRRRAKPKKERGPTCLDWMCFLMNSTAVSETMPSLPPGPHPACTLNLNDRRCLVLSLYLALVMVTSIQYSNSLRAARSGHGTVHQATTQSSHSHHTVTTQSPRPQSPCSHHTARRSTEVHRGPQRGRITRNIAHVAGAMLTFLASFGCVIENPSLRFGELADPENWNLLMMFAQGLSVAAVNWTSLYLRVHHVVFHSTH